MNRRRLAYLAALAIAGAPLGCSGPVDLAEHGARQGTLIEQPTQLHVPQQTPARTTDDELEALERRAPGFGGLYLDTDGILRVYVRGSGAAGVIEEVRRAVMAGSPPAVAEQLLSRIEAVPAAFDYSQLRGWYRRISSIHADPRVVYTDIAEHLNRLVIGLVPGSDRESIEASIRGRGVPTDAVVLETAAPANISATLQDLVRPTVAGLRIGGSGGSCTLGYNAHEAVGSYPNMTLDTAQRYFLTAAHCTPTFGSSNGSAMGQPTVANTIGYEIVDPPLFTSAEDGRCPQGRQCRYSDAALFEYTPSVSMQLQGIARTSGLTIVGTDSIVNINPCPYWCVMVGWSQVRLVGSTSGAQTGTVQSVRADVKQYNQGVDTGRTLLCQTRASYTSAGGDSGAPVVSSNADANKTLQGIHWGTSILPEGGPIFATFSLAQQAHREIVNASGVLVAPCPGSGCFLWY